MSLYERLYEAKRCKCWRVVCARIRDIAKIKEQEGVPYEDTLKDLNYEYYRDAVKRRF